LISVAEKWGLYRHIRFNSVVEEASWNDETYQWEVGVQVSGGKAAEFGSEYSVHCDYLISGVGQLNTPYYPAIEGLSSFQGTVMHSARWNWNKPLDGKRIAIIGNGATAAQIVPELAKVASDLTIFQRTPNWIVPRDDKLIPAMRKALYRYLPTIRRRYRSRLMDFRESFYDAAVVEDSAMNHEIARMCTTMMKTQLSNKPELIDALTPTYPPGCKRIIISDDYYPALNRPNVHLQTQGIKKITSQGIASGEDELAFDAIILATGFQTVDFLSPVEISGIQGRSLREIWKHGAQAYLGVTVASLPNFGMLYGPNTNLGHNSIILMIEAQSRYIAQMVAKVVQARQRGQALRIVPLQDTMDAYNKELQGHLKDSTFASDQCQSWYKNAEGVVINNWAGSVIEYQTRLSSISWADYELTGSAAEALAETKSSHIGRVVEESQSWGPWLAHAGVIASIAVAAGAVLLNRMPQLRLGHV
jgi:cation diffusion facilitator CzcD-associated flavoprotein CzcO